LVFSSYLFIFYFLPPSLLLCFALNKAPARARNFALIVLGYIFYGWANPRFLPLMFGTTFIDWLLSLVIAFDSWRFWNWLKRPVEVLARAERSARQRRAITLSVVSNLTMLGFFKYFNFFVDSYNGALAGAGASSWQLHDVLRVALPLGISFYTFQSLSYTIDVYRGDARAMRSFIDFACFVSMFPHLVAGPILKFSFLADQLEARKITLDKCARGAAFFCLGMAKKVLLANACALVADAAFNASSRGPLEAWLGVLAYAFQIYFDFSGYSDMAIGLGLLLGFVFARNFDHPYRAISITDFWRRWHISLSTWLREYLYIPLGGNRRGHMRTYINLMLTMLLGGLWHGAAWNFVLWGAVHGVALATERAWLRSSTLVSKNAWQRALRIGATFSVVLFAWVFFRAVDLTHALAYFSSMLGTAGVGSAADLVTAQILQPYALWCLGVAAVAVWLLPDTWEFTQRLTLPKSVMCLSLFYLSVGLLATQSYNPFIYFMF
jgi:alginate O-acetyltransferase complex protein AlgI